MTFFYYITYCEYNGYKDRLSNCDFCRNQNKDHLYRSEQRMSYYTKKARTVYREENTLTNALSGKKEGVLHGLQADK